MKFSFDRERAIDDPNGPQSLLANLDSINTPDPGRSTSPQTAQRSDLSAGAGDQCRTDRRRGGVPRRPTARRQRDRESRTVRRTVFHDHLPQERTVGLRANSGYRGLLGQPRTELVGVKYYASSDNLKIDIENRYRHRLAQPSPTDIEGLRRNPRLVVHEAPGGELRYLVFNMNTMPGATPEQKLAVRKAVVATVVDRDALSRDVYRAPLRTRVFGCAAKYRRGQRGFQERSRRPARRGQARQFLTGAGIARCPSS